MSGILKRNSCFKLGCLPSSPRRFPFCASLKLHRPRQRGWCANVKSQIHLKPLDSVSRDGFYQFIISCLLFFFFPLREFCYLIRLYRLGSNLRGYLNEAVCCPVLPDSALGSLALMGCPAIVRFSLWWIKERTQCPEWVRVTGITSYCAELPVICNDCPSERKKPQRSINV